MTDDASAPVPPRVGWLILLLALLVLGCIAVVGLVVLRPAAVSPAEQLFDIPESAGPTTVSLTTSSPAEAAKWLGQKVGIEVPVIDLRDAGARIVGAQAFPAVNRGALQFENRLGVLISLHVTLRPAGPIEALAERSYGARRFRVGRTPHPVMSLAAWHAGTLTLIAASPISEDDLLPFADEMSKQWGAPR